MSKYSIGIDYGSLSGRAVLVNVETGEELASAIYEYPHAVMDETLPDGTPLGHDWALQHPQDYLDVLTHTIPEVIRGIDPGDIIGIGTDFTACTVLPAVSYTHLDVYKRQFVSSVRTGSLISPESSIARKPRKASSRTSRSGAFRSFNNVFLSIFVLRLSCVRHA